MYTTYTFKVSNTCGTRARSNTIVMAETKKNSANQSESRQCITEVEINNRDSFLANANICVSHIAFDVQWCSVYGKLLYERTPVQLQSLFESKFS